MKLLFSLILLGITVSVYGQGEVNFANRNTAITPAINAPISYDGTGPVAAQKIDGDNTVTAGPYTYGGIYARAALYGGPAGTPEHQLVLLGSAVGFRTNSTTAGYIIQETNPFRVIEGVLPGAAAVFQVRAWDAGVPDVDSYEQAEALIGSEHLVYRGKSPLLSVPALGGGGAPPADLIGLEPFSISGLPLEPPTPYLRIDVPPSSQVAVEGTNVTLRVVVWGTPLISYQWLFQGASLANATNDSLSFNPIRLADAGEYSVRVSNPAGVITSAVAVVTIIPRYGTVNFQNRNTATTPGINAPISYDGTGPVPAQRIDGANTYFSGPYIYGGIYARAGLYGGPAGTPEEQLVLLGTAVGFRTSPAAGYIQETNPVRMVQGVLPGAPAVFQVRAWDAGLPDIHSYEEGQALMGDGDCHPVYVGKSPLLNVSALGGNGAPPADLIGLQGFSLIGLAMAPIPARIRVSPQSQLATAGESVTLDVAVEGSYPIYYQWLFNGSPLPIATNNSLTINTIRLADAGGYSVRVSNCAGVATSEVAVVTVLMLWVKSGDLILSEPEYTFLGSAPIQIQSGFTNGTIFYTLDGTAPGPGSTPYLSRFVMDRSAVIRAIAYSADMAESYETPSIRINIVRPGFCAFSPATRGGGTVSVDPDLGTFPLGTPVNLTATAWPGWKFLGWAGDASGTNPATQLTMDRSKYVEAVFGTTIGTTCIGTGAVAHTPSLEYYPYGSKVQIAALPGAGSFFSAWGGVASGATNPLVLTVTNPNPSITCTFERLSASQYSLTVVPVGNGQVHGFINQLGNRFGSGTYLHLIASPDPGQQFVGWTGDVTGSNPVIGLMMDRSKTINAVFTKKPKLVVTTSYGHNDGLFRWSLAGNLGEAYTIYGSSNMVDWTEFQVFTNTLGRFYFVDPDTSNQSRRFFSVEGRH